MFAEALDELDSLPAETQEEAVVVEMFLVTLMQARRWSEALDRGRKLCELRPGEQSAFIHAAFCLHELGRPAEAKAWLLSGPPTLQHEANYFYNLACYECVLGNLTEARQLLARSFELDGKYRDFARTDPDLQALREDKGQ
jgi:predicted Zn-dependent protease